MMRTANPALNDNVFSGNGRVTAIDNDAMTIEGTVNKTGILLLLAIMSATWAWKLFYSGGQSLSIWIIGGLIGGFIASLVTIFKKEWAGITAPIYALFEGLVLGGISSIMEARYPGIVIPAVGLTFGTLFCLLLAYKTGFIKATENFKLGVFAATGAIGLIYLINMILGFFSIRIPFIHESGIIGIGFSLFVVVIAALNLVLDFDFIEKGAAYGAPKYMEWYSAFGLMVTLIWLYMEILRLLSKLRDRK